MTAPLKPELKTVPACFTWVTTVPDGRVIISSSTIRRVVDELTPTPFTNGLLLLPSRAYPSCRVPAEPAGAPVTVQVSRKEAPPSA